jgi:hypothetical protein|tara:strand:+ start:1927 stop:2883 length:957 start_codon:yes stop_codon:yes gene_type:complete
MSKEKFVPDPNNDEAGNKLAEEIWNKEHEVSQEDSPKEDPPVETPSKEDSPKEDPPKEDSPKEDTPKEDLPERKELFIPVGQVKAEKKTLEKELTEKHNNEVAALKQQLEEAKKSPQKPASVDDPRQKAINAFAEATGTDAKTVNDFAESLVPKTATPDNSRIEAVENKQKEQDAERGIEKERREQETLYTDQFQKDVAGNEELMTKLENLGYSSADVKQKLHDFVFTKEGMAYKKIPLGEVLTIRLDSLFPAKKKSAESSHGGSARGKGEKAFSKSNPATDEQVKAMNPKEFKEYSDMMGRGSVMTAGVRRQGKQLN